MLAGNLASIGVGAIVATISSLIVCVISLQFPFVLNLCLWCSGQPILIGNLPGLSTSLSQLLRKPLRRNLILITIRSRPMFLSREDLLRAILTILAKMNLTMWLWIKLSSLQLLRLLHWSVFDLIWIFKIYLYNLPFLVRHPHSGHPSASFFLPTYLWCCRFNRLGGRWNCLDILVCIFSCYLPTLGEPTGLVTDHEWYLQSAFSAVFAVCLLFTFHCAGSFYQG